MPLKTAACTALAALFLSAPSLSAQDVTADTVVARIGETEITMGHVIVVSQQLPDRVRSLPDDVLFNGIVDQLVDQYLLAQEAERIGDLPASIALQLENEGRALRASAAIGTLLRDAISDAQIETAYAEQYTSGTPDQEYNASHILVPTEEEALAIIEDLAGGADFASVAAEKSTGPSGPNGGQLPWFKQGDMVPEFEGAVVEMEPETVSAPVQTQFGWHVIRLNETRDIAPPPLEQVRTEILQTLQAQLVDEKVAELRATSDAEVLVDGIDPALFRDGSLLTE